MNRNLKQTTQHPLVTGCHLCSQSRSLDKGWHLSGLGMEETWTWVSTLTLTGWHRGNGLDQTKNAIQQTFISGFLHSRPLLDRRVEWEETQTCKCGEALSKVIAHGEKQYNREKGTEFWGPEKARCSRIMSGMCPQWKNLRAGVLGLRPRHCGFLQPLLRARLLWRGTSPVVLIARYGWREKWKRRKMESFQFRDDL